MNPQLLADLSRRIGDATQQRFDPQRAMPVGGGDINDSYRLEGHDGSRYFLKLKEPRNNNLNILAALTGALRRCRSLAGNGHAARPAPCIASRQHAHNCSTYYFSAPNEVRRLPMFETEAAGLAALAATHSVRVPRVICHGVAQGRGYLVLEYLELSSRGDARLLGEQLASMHRHTANNFGFAHDNFIGSTPQPNAQTGNWVDFWREQRLGFQLRLAAQNGHGSELQRSGEKLLEVLPAFFAGYSPQPSLLHGDLWGGNHGFLHDGTPLIFDPAVYFGDRECDIAMTELFGGYPADFHAAYRAAWPLDAGYAVRRDLYNLYHILNHANLFGGGYVGQAGKMIERLLAR